MKNIFVLDTNVLLGDPSALYSFKKNNVILPYKVIEELDKHKTSNGVLGLNARDCTRKIVNLFKNTKSVNLHQGIQIPKHGKLKVVSEKDVPEHGVDIQNSDDNILAVCVGIKKNWENCEPVLVSNDALLTLKASSYGVKVQSYAKDTRNTKEIDGIYEGYKKISVSDSIVSSYWEQFHKGEICFSIDHNKITKEKLNTNDFVQLIGENGNVKQKPYQILRYTEQGEYKFVHEQKLDKIRPVNPEQTMALDLLLDPTVELVSLTGISGTGKTILAIAAGLEQVLNQKKYRNIIIIRPMHAVGKDVGYLPGLKEEKLEPWTAPIKDNIKFCISTDNGKNSRRNEEALHYLTERGIIEIEAMTYVRGRSLAEAFIIIDESQNIDKYELKTILTRVGKNTKIVLTGDVEQTDRNDVDSLTNGLSIAIDKFKKYDLSGHVKMREGIRSRLSALAAEIL